MDEYNDEYDDFEIEEVHESDDDVIAYDPSTDAINWDGSAKAIYDQCMEPTIHSAMEQIIWLLFMCVFFKFLTQAGALPRLTGHFISILTGLISLFSVVGPIGLYLCFLGAASYWCLMFCSGRAFGGHTYQIVAGSLLIYMVVREYYVKLEPWEEVRGVQMVMVMKAMSLCYEISSGARKEIPPFLNFVGYLFCPGTVVFGPWIPYGAYMGVFHNRRWGLGWGMKAFATGLIALICLGFSSCWVYYIFAGINFRWISAFRDAMSVRYSHYFISFLSELTATLCGFYSEDGDVFEITNPWKIEIPRSLVEVVIFWNVSIHRWLRLHVFRPAKHLGPFKSVLVTFLVSSMLHGLSVNLTLVLMSLGFFTYVEYTLREKLSSIFDCCVRSRRCPPDCGHTYKSSHHLVVLVNILFGISTMFHLAYLGVMIAHTSEIKRASNGFVDRVTNSLKRWENLDYASHWAMFALFFGNAVI